MFVANVPSFIKDHELRSFFQNFGKIDTAYSIEHKSQKGPKFGYVVFATQGDFEKVLKMDLYLRGMKLNLQRFKGRKNKW